MLNRMQGNILILHTPLTSGMGFRGQMLKLLSHTWGLQKKIHIGESTLFS